MMWRRERRGRVARHAGLIKLLGLVVLMIVLSAPARAQVPPDESWRSVTTPHFVVTFPAHLESLGRKAADRAERAYEALSIAFIAPPDGSIDILLTDHQDISNGFAQVTPSNRITIFARPPVDDPGLGYVDEWLELVITHELAHIIHIDPARNPIGTLARRVFGRVTGPWPFFPTNGTPRWITEGVATFYESELTEAGRVDGTFHEMVLRTAALEGRFESMGQAQGESPQWPSGDRQYAYGSRFFDYLTAKYGADRMGAFADAIAGQWVPYRINAAGRDAFGASLSDEWSLWSDSLQAAVGLLDDRLATNGPITEPERLTVGARRALRPRVSPDGRSVLYSRSDGRSDTQLYLTRADGSGGRSLTRTNGGSTHDWAPDGSVIFSQLDYVDRYRLFDDLYRVRVDGGVTRITRGARLTDPSVGPDGSWAVAVSEGGGTTGLVRVDLATGETSSLVEGEPETHWAFPSVSPDGRWIAVTRWTPEAHHDVVVLDMQGAITAEVTRDRAIDLAPDWSPDGRYVIWASDRTGILNILAAPFDAGTGQAGAPLLLTNVRTGAAYPSVDPSGPWLYFSGYHVDGWELERTPFDPSSAAPAPAPDTRFAEVASPVARGSWEGESQEYVPGLSLGPNYWELVLREPVVAPAVRTDDLFLRERQLLGLGIGAQTSGVDLVGRHSWAALYSYFTTGKRGEGGFSYSYAGLGNPTIGFSASQRWDRNEQATLVSSIPQPDPLGLPPDLDTLFVLERNRNLSVSAQFHRRSFRRSLFVTVSGGLGWEQLDLLDNNLGSEPDFRLTRPANRLSDFSVSLSFNTAREHAFQMGGSNGINLFVRGRTRRNLSLPDSLVHRTGVDRSVDDLIGRARAYIPIRTGGYASHVLAFQGSFGVAGGPNASAGFFDVGGASGSTEQLTGLSLFGGSVFFPVRGYPVSARFGRYVWTAAAEYRVPLALVNRGMSSLPFHFDRVVGALFADAGNAWGPDVSPSGFQNSQRAALYSVGGEVTAEVLTFYRVNMRMRVGLAFPLTGATGSSLYLRLGMPF
jgi:Tol biopolymer transport system component